MSNALEEIKKKNAELKKLIADTTQESVLKDLFLEWFKGAPKEVEAIRWTQYTPHFNDGDACVFSVHEPSLKLVGVTKDEDEEGFQDVWALKYYKKVTEEKATELSKSLNALYSDMQDLEDVMLSAFGDGYQVTITRKGDIEVDEYDHD